MQSNQFVPTPQDIDLLNRVARAIARARGLSPADVDDFAQAVHLKMAERHYDVFHKFEGRASLSTYLAVVLSRQLKDWQNHEYGRWRPCAAARRHGPIGASLDQEVNRDGRPVDEAIRLIMSQTMRPEEEVQRIADALPRRARRRHVDLEAAQHRDVAFVDPVAADQRARTLARLRAALLRALADLPVREARLFVGRYQAQKTVAELARADGEDAKGLYRRFDRIRRRLREHMQAHGVHSESCAE